MGRNRKSGEEKAVIISISCTHTEKEFLDFKGISPSKLFQEAIQKLKVGEKKNPLVFRIENDIEIIRKYYVDGIKPNGDFQVYLKSISKFLEKYPDWTKAEIMARAERPRHIVLEDSVSDCDDLRDSIKRDEK